MGWHRFIRWLSVFVPHLENLVQQLKTRFASHGTECCLLQYLVPITSLKHLWAILVSFSVYMRVTLDQDRVRHLEFEMGQSHRTTEDCSGCSRCLWQAVLPEHTPSTTDLCHLVCYICNGWKILLHSLSTAHIQQKHNGRKSAGWPCTLDNK